MHLCTHIRAPLTMARRALDEHVVEVLGGDERHGERRRRFSMPLTVDLGAGTTLRQVVEVTVGRPGSEGGGVLRMPLAWTVTGRHLFPTFEGAIEIRPDEPGCEFALTGRYEVPSGLLGRLGDAAAGRRVAQRSFEELVAELGCRLDAVVERRRPGAGFRQGARHQIIDLRDPPKPATAEAAQVAAGDRARSELYIG